MVEYLIIVIIFMVVLFGFAVTIFYGVDRLYRRLDQKISKVGLSSCENTKRMLSMLREHRHGE